MVDSLSYEKIRMGTVKEEIKLEKAKLANKKFEQSQKEKSSRRFSTIYKKLSKPLTSKSIVKSSKVTAYIPEYKAPSVLGDENRFFKKTMEQAKKEMFFS